VIIEFEKTQELIAEFAPRDNYVEEYRHMEQMYLPALFQSLEALPSGRAIEVGPGWGTTASWLRDGGWSVTVVDLLPVGTFMTQELIDHLGIRYVLHNVEDSPPDNVELGSFDLAIMTQVIPHLVWRPDRALRNARSIVRPGGTLVTSALDRADYPDLEATYGDDWRTVPVWGSTEPSTDMVKCMYTRASFQDLLNEVFEEFTIWKPPESTVLFATATC
jgi:2-polyprenyl-3-methyl-5-hydroxy-6-metoxy-1,4-benzoquinol methylase